MSIAHEFEYQKPKDLRAALKLVAAYGKKGRILAGGTDLIGWIREEMITPEIVIDIKGIKDLAKISFKNGVLSLGALVTFSDVIESRTAREKFPLLWEAAPQSGFGWHSQPCDACRQYLLGGALL